MLRVIGLLCFVLSSNAASVPSFITPCKLGDDACLLSSTKSAVPLFVKGIPELGIKRLDPMHIPLVVSDTGTLKFKFQNSSLTGLTNCNIDTMKFDHVKMKQFMKATCDLSLTGHYQLGGQLLLLAVEGNSKYKIDIRGIVVKISTDLKEVTKDGVPHFHIDKWHHHYKVLNRVTFDFENLFNGNKVLGEPILELVNTNWKDIMDEIATPVVETIISQEVEAVEALYSAIPINDLIVH